MRIRGRDLWISSLFQCGIRFALGQTPFSLSNSFLDLLSDMKKTGFRSIELRRVPKKHAFLAGEALVSSKGSRTPTLDRLRIRRPGQRLK